MNNPESIEIIDRFFEALDFLIANKQIRGIKTFTERYGINRWNFNTVRKERHRDIFQLSWLSYMINDFGISAEWLMSGKGGMLSKKE